MIRRAALAVQIASLFGCLFGCILGCSGRYGSYITFESATKFDRIELYFGVAVADVVPTTPRHPQLRADAQIAFERQVADADIQKFGAPVTSYTAYLPFDSDNQVLSYVLAIGYVGTERVAIGELFDLQVLDEDEARIYTVAMSAYNASDLDEWGRNALTPDCIRYERSRPDGQPRVISIGRHNDRDCDDFPDYDERAPDCDPLLYCDGSGTGACIGSTPCVNDANECSIGVCSNLQGAARSCEVTTCVSDTLCRVCDLAKPPAELLECALLSSASHPEDIRVRVRAGARQLCENPTVIDIVLPFPCTNPSIDAVSYYVAGPSFLFEFDPAASAANVCRLRIDSYVPTDPFSTVPHLLVSVDTATSRRLAFVVGLVEDPGPCPTPGNVREVVYDPNTGACTD